MEKQYYIKKAEVSTIIVSGTKASRRFKYVPERTEKRLLRRKTVRAHIADTWDDEWLEKLPNNGYFIEGGIVMVKPEVKVVMNNKEEYFLYFDTFEEAIKCIEDCIADGKDYIVYKSIL